MNKIPLPTSAKRAADLTWRLALAVLERIEEIIGSNGAMETAVKLLDENALLTQRKIDYSFIDRINDCLVTGGNGAAPDIKFLSVAILDERTRGHLNVFVQACNALLVQDFGALVRFRLKVSGLTCRNAATQSGIPLRKWKNWCQKRSKFATDMDPGQSLQLDRVLGANVEIIAAYAATSQYSVFQFKKCVADTLLERTSFGHLLRQCWRRTKFNKRELLHQIKSLTGISISESVFSRWCCGLALPSLEKEPAIAALDGICGFGKKLLTAWTDAKPRTIYSKYNFALTSWPTELEDELAGIFASKSDNDADDDEDDDEDYDDEDDEDDDDLVANGQWRNATKKLFAKFAEHFFGYLLRLRTDGTMVDEKAVPAATDQARLEAGMKFWAGSLSFTLMGCWKFVEGYYEYVRSRTGRAHYTMSELNQTKTLLSLYRVYMPRLAARAVEQPYWVAKWFAPMAAEAQKGIIARIPEQTEGNHWQCQLDQAEAGAWNFLRTKQFYREPFRAKVQPLLDRKVAMWAIAAEIEARVKDLPLQVLCLKTAVEIRKLAIAALLWARCFRPATLASLNLNQVFLVDGERIGVDIDEEHFKNGGNGGCEGGIKGLLADVGWFFTAIRRWKKEGRPFIIRHAMAKGGKDNGHFLIGARFGRSKHPGDSISAKTLYHDVVSVHGYPPYGQRYLFASAAWIAGATIEDIAANIHNTPLIALGSYSVATEAEKTARADKAMAALLACGG